MKRNHARIAASGAAVMVPTAASVLVLDATHAISAGATARLVGKINLDHTKQQSRPRTMPIGAYEGGDLYNRGWRNLIRTSIQLLSRRPCLRIAPRSNPQASITSCLFGFSD